MRKERIKYTDYDGNVREEDFYFNLSKAELIKFEYSMPGGIKQYIEKIIMTQDTTEIYRMFTHIIELSYGEKSSDGKRFVKNKELADSFIQSEAYSELIYKMIQNAEFAAEFINDILPKEV